MPAASLFAVIAAGFWAMMPLPEAPVSADVEHFSATSAAAETPAPSPLDIAAFTAPLWIVEAPPPPPPPVPAPPPPLKLQLLAIVREGDAHKAAIYDPETDRLVVVGTGEKVGARTVQTVSASAVEITDAAGNHRLALSPDEGGRR